MQDFTIMISGFTCVQKEVGVLFVLELMCYLCDHRAWQDGPPVQARAVRLRCKLPKFHHLKYQEKNIQVAVP
jgi:hypothetical protein